MTQERTPTPRLRIEGRGPVAIALRLFLARQGFTADAVLHERFASRLPDWLESRPLALSLGSWQLLSRIITLPAAAAIRSVEVSIVGRPGCTRLRAADIDSHGDSSNDSTGHASALGHVVRYGALHRALVDAFAGIGPSARADTAEAADAIGARAETSSFDAPDDQVALVVIADGEPRGAAPRQGDWRVHDFDQSALLAEVLADHDADGVAFERFTDQGPLALLPLPEPGRHALVWCARPERTAHRAALPADEFDAELRGLFGPTLGALHVTGIRHQVPLQRKLEARGDDRRRVAVGNAAQTLHPVAGQGLNLGLRDAFELAQQLGNARGAGRPLADVATRFRRSRLADRAATVGITDALARLFTLPALAPVESIALGALDLLAPLRNRFARALMFGLRSG